MTRESFDAALRGVVAREENRAAKEQHEARQAATNSDSSNIDFQTCLRTNKGAIAIVETEEVIESALREAQASGMPIGVFMHGVGNDRESLEQSARETAEARSMFVIAILDPTAFGKTSPPSTVMDLALIPMLVLGQGNVYAFDSKVRAFGAIDLLKTVLSALNEYSGESRTEVTLIAHSRGGMIADIAGNEHGRYGNMNSETYGSAHLGGLGDSWETEHHRWFAGDPVFLTGPYRAFMSSESDKIKVTLGWGANVHSYSEYLHFFWGN